MTSQTARLKLFIKGLTGAVTNIKDGGKRSVLLTFDDGPHPEVTPQVLDLLERYRARAVFFVVGARIERAPHMLRNIIERGHAIGNHSFSHNNKRPLPLPAYVADLQKCQEAIAAVAGVKPRLYRPPLGRISLPSIVACQWLGLRTVLWSLNTDDWRIRDDSVKAREQGRRLVAEHFSASTGSRNEIVLMHDDNECSVSVLEELLPALTALDCDLWEGLEQIQGRAV